MSSSQTARSIPESIKSRSNTSNPPPPLRPKENNVNPVNCSWKWGVDELPIVDQYQYAYLGVENSKDCSWDTHMAKVMGKGEAHVCNMDAIAILTDSRLDTRIKRCILMNVVVPKLEYAGQVWKVDAKIVKRLETIELTAAKKNTKMLKYDA